MDKSMFVVRPPAVDDPGRYILIIQRAGGMMSPGSATAYAIERLDLTFRGEVPLLHQGFIEDRLIVEFPYGTPYTLVDRTLIKQLSRADAAVEEWTDEKELQILEQAWREANPQPTPTQSAGGEPVVMGLETGMYL